jgi:oligopeptide transport system substrate-binding protein
MSRPITRPISRPLTGAALLAAALLCLATAAPAATYVRGNDGDPETLDQHKTSTVAESHILRDLYEGLLAYDAAANVVPGVAESWTISDDGLTYTFKLRPDAKWSNGDPVTAADFVYSFNRIMDPATGAKYATILYPIRNAEAINKGETAELGVTALDDQTLQITLEAPTPYFLELLTHQTGLPVHKGSIEKFGADFVRPGNMVSNGAYMLDGFTPNDKIVLKKNPNFHDAANVAIETVEYTPFEDRATCARRFEAGEVQSCSDIAAEQIKDLKARLGDQVRVAPYLGVYYYALNGAHPPLDDARVRQALSMAIDRDFLANDLVGHHAARLVLGAAGDRQLYRNPAQPRLCRPADARPRGQGGRAARRRRLRPRQAARGRDQLQHRREPQEHRHRHRLDVGTAGRDRHLQRPGRLGPLRDAARREGP